MYAPGKLNVKFMKKLTVEPTNQCPSVEFNPDGKLIMTGKSLPPDITKLFLPLFDFVNQLSVKHVTFDIFLEYFNISTSKMLLELMKAIEKNSFVEEVLVNWHYEEGDENSYEMTEIYKLNLHKTIFNYHVHAESI